MPKNLDALLALTAKLYYVDELPQNEVAKIVRLSQSQVSRMLTLARTRGIVRISVDKVAVRNHELEERLAEVFDLHRAIVIASIEDGKGDMETGLGCAQSSDLVEVLRAAKVIGVTGGRTLSHFIRAIGRGPVGESPIVMPLIGSFGPQLSSLDAVELSRALARRLGGQSYLINAPAYPNDAATRDLFLRHGDIQAVWKLFDRMDVAMVGVALVEDVGAVEAGLLDHMELERVSKSGAVGTIAGRFFDAEGRECRSTFRERVLSIDLDVLRRVREVIGMSHGAKRAGVVRAAVRGGIVKTLVVDSTCATAVLGDDKPGGGP
jgi:DNA-binding transcriptional regulator LsrR (DeoR family)